MRKIIISLLFVIVSVPIVSFASINTNLKYGTRGTEVKELQEFLISKGFLSGQSTGNFFTLTRNAVMQYQASQNLPATGFVGPMTREKMNTELSKADSSSDSAEINETGTSTSPSTKSTTQQQIQDLLNKISQLNSQMSQLNQNTQTQIQQNNQIIQANQNQSSSNTGQAVTPEPQHISVALNKTCKAGHTAYLLTHDKPYYKGGVKGTAKLPDSTTSSINWAWDNRGQVMDDSIYTPTLGGDDFPVDTIIDYTFSLKDNSGTEVGSLSGSLTVESCQ